MTKLVLISRDYDMAHLAGSVRRAAPELEVTLFGTNESADAEVAVCWNPPVGAVATFPRLRLIHSIGAGVDNIISDKTLPNLPLCRVVDNQQARAMSEFVTWGVLHFHRQLDRVLANQRDKIWLRYDQSATASCNVGVMGLGEIGTRVAEDLLRFGFSVNGWSKRHKNLPGIKSFSGPGELRPFLENTVILALLRTQWVMRLSGHSR